jgi:hypothetical protein
MTTWTWGDREWLKTNYNHPHLDLPPTENLVRLFCMETGVSLLYNKFGITLQGQPVADRDHVARVFGDTLMSIHLFLHVGATKWLGFDAHSVLLVGACLSPERGMEKKPLIIVDYTKASAFGLLKDQTADVRERAKAANGDFRREIHRHTCVKNGEGGNQFLALTDIGWLREALASAEGLDTEGTARCIDNMAAMISEVIQPLPGDATPTSNAADSSQQVGPFTAFDYAGPWAPMSMEDILYWAAMGYNFAVILHAATTPDVEVAEALKTGLAVWGDTLLPKDSPAPTAATSSSSTSAATAATTTVEEAVEAAPPRRRSTRVLPAVAPAPAAPAPAPKAQAQSGKAPSKAPSKAPKADSTTPSKAPKADSTTANKKAKKDDEKAEVKLESSSRAVLGQQVRFKVLKLKTLMEDGASEALVTAAYMEVKEDYPGKYEPATVTAKKWDSTLKAAEVKYPTLDPSAPPPAEAPAHASPRRLDSIVAAIQAQTATAAAKAAADAVDKALGALQAANEQAARSQIALADEMKQTSEVATAAAKEAGKAATEATAAAAASTSAFASVSACLPVASAAPAAAVPPATPGFTFAYPLPSTHSMHPSVHASMHPVPSTASSMHPSTHPMQPVEANRQAIISQLILVQADEAARVAGVTAREQAQRETAAQQKAYLNSLLLNLQ